MQSENFIEQLNVWGRKKVPFLFLIDFELEKPRAWTLDQINPDEMLYSINGFSNAPFGEKSAQAIHIEKHPILFEEYKQIFDRVHKHLLNGDTFLVNLTIKTKVEINSSMKDLFHQSDARYKCWLRNELLFFSPEIFVKIRNGKITSYPMKGTIDAALPDAAKIILESKKELAEHVTIVDLIRNDLSRVATNVTINRFRYLDEIVAKDKKLLQVSSEIAGDLPFDYCTQLGDLIVSLLPAGSVSGAPKVKTCQIIREAEREKRGYYTGVFGYFDGENLDSGVAIRFIEQQVGDTFYRSGGGLTSQSLAEEEYKEVIQKIYVPVA
jgi:para-aminobenzoate synthetase component I